MCTEYIQRANWLIDWSEGNGHHCHITGECVPDFTCCYEGFEGLSLYRRKIFVEAYIGHEYHTVYLLMREVIDRLPK